jgi:hypothetical protein
LGKFFIDQIPGMQQHLQPAVEEIGASKVDVSQMGNPCLPFFYPCI